MSDKLTLFNSQFCVPTGHLPKGDKLFPMTLEQTLIKAGLSEKEAKLYLALLEQGSASVLELAKKTGIKRPTVYVVIEEMREKSYVAKAMQENKVRYVAKSPEMILQGLNEKQELVKGILGELKAMTGVSNTRPRVQIYEGLRSIRKMYEEMLRSQEVRFFSSLKQVKKYFSDLIAPFLNHPTLFVKDILVDDPVDREYVDKATGPNYQARFMPPFTLCSIDLAIFGNKVAISSVKKELISVVIESEEIASSLRALHEFVWEKATLLRKEAV